jgi:hypothetical protein
MDARLTTLLCENDFFYEIRSSGNRMANLAEPSKRGYGSKRAVLPVMMMMTML